MALTETSHDFGTLSPGETYTFAFINQQNLAVSACKLQDADGNLATADDQAPVAGWSVYLRIDGVRQEPGKSTESNGCASWSGLNETNVYGVEEDVGEDWTALTDTSHDFGILSPGQPYSFTFINHLSLISVYLPLIVQ